VTVWLDDLMQEAAKVALQYFRKDFEVIQKPDGSPVTSADLAVNDLLLNALRDRYPNDCFASEEALPSDEERAAATRVWFIDPIDGTSHFIDGRTDFGILIGLWENGAIVESAACFPALGRRMLAEHGKGCLVDGRPARVTEQTNMDKARISCWGREYRSLDTLSEPMGLPAYATLQICSGELDGSIMKVGNWGEHDVAFACAAVDEAGGKITDGQDQPLRFESEGAPHVPPVIVCSNGALHRALLGWV
jgi:myo-inositol-1(or 4)-monophosphatase